MLPPADAPGSPDAPRERSAESPAETPLVELTIESLAQGGDGVGREPGGRVVFVPFTAPGDRVRVRLVRIRPRFAHGVVEALLAPGPSRVEPPCEVFGRCGGCAWQHVDYAEQVEAKRAIVRDAFERIGHLAVPGPLEVTPCPSPYGYRTRARVRVEGDRVGYREAGSHALCPTTRCPILVPALEQALAGLPARARGRRGDWWLAEGADGSVHVAPARGPGRRAARVPLRVGGHALSADATAFVQANGPLFEPLAEAVVEWAGSGAAALELFAGAGYLTVGLADRFDRVVAVEGDRRAVRDLERNVGHRPGVEIVAGAVEQALRRAPVAGLRPDVVVLDPPRSGLPGDAATTLVREAPQRIVYLSCDPATLARDAATLAGAGYRLDRVRGFDLFPQTPHVEVLCRLVAGGSAEGPAGG
jgi:23S rRNA (uracil1939-C5)-methyltransferase